MQLHELKPNHRKYSKPRVGRGGKRGTTSGRGTKGQKARAGHRIRPAERDLIQRLPKLRGSSNVVPKKNKRQAIINVGELERLAPNGVVNRETVGAVKILGDGEVKKAFVVKGLKLSKTARQKIEAAGGKIID